MPESLPLGWPEKVRILDHAGSLSRWADRKLAQRLFDSGGFKMLRTKKRITGLKAQSERLVSAREAAELQAVRRRGAGDSHQRETYFNPPGVWTINSISDSVHPIFTTVVDGCSRAA